MLHNILVISGELIRHRVLVVEPGFGEVGEEFDIAHAVLFGDGVKIAVYGVQRGVELHWVAVDFLLRHDLPGLLEGPMRAGAAVGVLHAGRPFLGGFAVHRQDGVGRAIAAHAPPAGAAGHFIGAEILVELAGNPLHLAVHREADAAQGLGAAVPAVVARIVGLRLADWHMVHFRAAVIPALRVAVPAGKTPLPALDPRIACILRGVSAVVIVFPAAPVAEAAFHAVAAVAFPVAAAVMAPSAVHEHHFRKFIHSCAPLRSRGGRSRRGSAVNRGEVVRRARAGAAQQPERAAVRAGRNHRRIPRAGTDARRRHLRAAAVCQRVLLPQVKIGKQRVMEESGHKRRMMLQFPHE